MKNRTNTMYSKLMLILLFMVIRPGILHADADESYKKAVESKENVKDKLYPKKKKFELDLPNVGIVLNQSYVNTFLIGGGFNYFASEEWGFGLDFTMASNKDKPERGCIENFYNDPLDEIGDPCGGPDALANTKGNYGPAYVPIREIQNIIALNVTWNPVYGKQLIFLSATSYFDLFVDMGLGLVSSRFYPKEETLRNGSQSRGKFQQNGDNPGAKGSAEHIGAEVDETDSYGVEGRPDPVNQTNVAAIFAVGQKFHFAKRFHIKLFLRNITLLGTPTGFENIFALYGGAGVRF